MRDESKTKAQLIRELAELRQRVAELETAETEHRQMEIAADITERLETEKALRESEARYKSLYSMVRLMCDNVPDMIWAKDLEKKYIFANKAICEKLLHAKDTGEPVGKTDMYFAGRERKAHPDHPQWHTFGEICADSDSVVMKNRQPERFDEFGKVQGEFLFLDVYKAPFWDEQGEMIGTVGCGRIVTKEKRNEAEREQLLAELERRTRQLAALHETALDITTRRDMPELLEAIVTRAANLLGVSGGAVHIVAPDGETLTMAATQGTGKTLRGAQLRRGEGMAGRVLASGQPLIVESYDQWPGRAAAYSPGIFGSAIAVPMKLAGQVIGAISCHTAAGVSHPFDQEDMYLLEGLARQAAVAIENARLFAAERRHSAELEILRQASLRLTSTLEPQPVLEAITGYALQLAAANNAHIFLYHGQRLAFGAAQWAGERQQKPFSEPRPHGLTYAVARSGERVVVPDVERHPLFRDYQWHGAIIGLPLRSGSQVCGVMNVAFRQPRAFDEDELRLLELLADQAAIALQNVRLFAETSRRADQMAVVHALGRQITPLLDVDELLQMAVEALHARFGYLSVQLYLLDREANELEARGVAGEAGLVVRGYRQKVGQGITGRAARLGERVLIGDVSQEPGFIACVPGIRSELVLPIWVAGTLAGVLNVESDQLDGFDEADVVALEALVGQLGVALENARLYERARQDAETKTMLLREVNHRVKNNLTGIIGLLYAARGHARVVDQATYRSAMDDLIGRVRGLATAHDMLSAAGWTSVRLSDLATRIIHTSLRALPYDKQVSVNVPLSPVRITADEAHNLALAINELTTNAVKHAVEERDTVRITCQIERDNGAVCCLFRDDGPGYPEDVLRLEQYNMGLDLIQNIAHDNLHGELSLHNDHGAVAIIRFKSRDGC